MTKRGRKPRRTPKAAEHTKKEVEKKTIRNSVSEVRRG
jgi:hypothetical protein